MDIRFLLIIPVFLAGVIIKAIYDNITEKKNIERRLALQWGKHPYTEYVPGKMESIRKYYDSMAEDCDIDDITWNDLDMDGIFMLLNHTESAMGEEVLYKILRKPLYDVPEIKYRNKLIDYFYNNVSDRNSISKCLCKIGKNDKKSFFEIFSHISNIKKEANTIHYLINIFWIIGIAGAFFYIQFFVPLIILNVIFSIISYYKRKSEISMYYTTFGYILRMLYIADKITGLDIDIINKEISNLKKYYKELASFRRFSGIVLSGNGGNLLDIFFDYVRMITHIDLIKFNNMLDSVIEKKDIILEIHNIIGYLDAMIATASYREMKKDSGICIPEITDDRSHKYMEVTDIYHPFLSEPVYNSICADNGILVTGSNASGKSTFLKSIAINAILAQTIATVNAQSYKACCFKIMTSMALADNIVNNQSYFIVEILSLKRILTSDCEIPVLCCIDEVLRGTNTIERIAASSRILYKLNTKNVLCFAATHDTELTNILKNSYSNYHFQERIEDDNIIFDYVLHPGASVTRNAIRLLNMMQYDEDIVEEAYNLADTFEKTGTWSIL